LIRLLIADDHAIVRSGLAQIFALTTDVHVAGEACNGLEAMALLRQQSFDVVLMDLNMPGISGSELIERVKAQQSGLPILVLSMHDSPQVAAQALRAGADGFMTKDCEPEVLLSAIRKVAAHGRYIAPDIAVKIAFDASTPDQREPHLDLSARELTVLRFLTQGLTVKAIGAQLSISSKTVSTHKVRLMEKLGTPSMADLMRYAIEHKLQGEVF
jgi:DNA-binding NarL/FixJ family response regulator